MTQDSSSVHVTARDWPYRDLDTPLTGVLCRDETLPGVRPGILLVHGGAGLDEHAREQARRYAARGYIVLACDMFGDGIAGNRDRVIGCLTTLRDDPPLMVRRAQAGLAALARCPGTDGRVAAIGFCFGGLAVLRLARSGEPIAGAVSIHGSLGTSRRAEPGTIRARLLICHGAVDPHVPLSDVTAFAEEMNGAGADWQLIMYGGAQHGFTRSRAIPGAIPGVAYDPLADTRSFAATGSFLTEIFTGGRDQPQQPCAVLSARQPCYPPDMSDAEWAVAETTLPAHWPKCETGAMGFYGDQILPRFLNIIMSRGDITELRARVASGLTGEVLEIGFGSGLNVPHYPPTLTRVRALDPATVGRRLGAKRVAASPVPIDFVGLDAQTIPLPGESVDHVLTTWTLCTIPDVSQALAEVRRVLRPGGVLHFIEHGRSPDLKVARFQDRINSVHGRLFGGCQLNRPIDRIVTGAGLELTQLKTYYRPGPAFDGYTFEGTAAKAVTPSG